MAKVKLADGSEAEMFSAEEVAAKEAAAAEAAKAALAPQLEELGKLKDKDTNFTKLKEDTERTLKEANDKIAELSGKVSQSFQDKKQAMLDKLSGGDQERRAKIELEWAKFNGEPSSEAEIEARALSSFRLAVPEANPSSLDQALAFVGSRRVAAAPTGADAIPETTKQMGAVLGVTEDDYKKYGDRVAASK